MCERRSVGVRCDDSPHDGAARPSLRTFHTASPRTRVNSVGWERLAPLLPPHRAEDGHGFVLIG
jgi:hypothetical protein